MVGLYRNDKLAIFAIRVLPKRNGSALARVDGLGLHQLEDVVRVSAYMYGSDRIRLAIGVLHVANANNVFEKVFVKALWRRLIVDAIQLARLRAYPVERNVVAKLGLLVLHMVKEIPAAIKLLQIVGWKVSVRCSSS